MPVDVLLLVSTRTGRYGAVIGAQRPDALAPHPVEQGKRHPDALGRKGKKSLGWLLVTGVPDNVAWYTGPGLNEVECKLTWPDDDGTWRWRIHEGRARAATARAPTLVDRALDPQQATDVDDLPTLPWAACVSILSDARAGPNSTATEADIVAHNPPVTD